MAEQRNNSGHVSAFHPAAKLVQTILANHPAAAPGAVVVPIRGPDPGIRIVAPIRAGEQANMSIRCPISIDFRP